MLGVLGIYVQSFVEWRGDRKAIKWVEGIDRQNLMEGMGDGIWQSSLREY